jgi:hypothetical protein
VHKPIARQRGELRAIEIVEELTPRLAMPLHLDEVSPGV